jgi:hypothetical protein
MRCTFDHEPKASPSDIVRPPIALLLIVPVFGIVPQQPFNSFGRASGVIVLERQNVAVNVTLRPLTDANVPIVGTQQRPRRRMRLLGCVRVPVRRTERRRRIGLLRGTLNALGGFVPCLRHLQENLAFAVGLGGTCPAKAFVSIFAKFFRRQTGRRHGSLPTVSFLCPNYYCTSLPQSSLSRSD